MNIEKKYSNEFLWDILKRLLTLNQIGGYITSRDGHRWIDWIADDDYVFPMAVQLEIITRSKVYGGIVDALDRVDESLSKLGERSLTERYDEDETPLE